MIAPTTAMSIAQLKEAVGLAMFKSAKEISENNARQLLQDFSKNQQQIKQAVHPYLGNRIDISI